MKKIIKYICLALALAALSSLLFCGCGGEETKEDIPTETQIETETESAGADTAAQSEGSESNDAGSVPNPFEGLETVSEEFSITDVGGRFENSKQYTLLKKNLYVSGDAKYNWYEFYNACIAGKIDLSDPEVLVYAEECRDFFTEYSLEDEAAQAKTVIDLLGETE